MSVVDISPGPGQAAPAVRGDEFRERGYIVARGFFSAEEMLELRAVVTAARPRASGDDWLTTGRMVFRSNLYFHSPDLQRFLSQPRLVEFLTPIIGPAFWLRWDQAVDKLPGGVEFPWHQDNAYNHLLVPHYQLWIAVTPIRRENGGLWLDPGSHRSGLLPHRFVGHSAVYHGKPANPVLLEAEVGDVILFSSFLLHYTSPNRSRDARLAYVAEYVPLDDFDPYVRPPYFVVARDGRSHPEFVRFFRGRLRVRNQLGYLLPRLRVAGSSLVAAARRLVRPKE